MIQLGDCTSADLSVRFEAALVYATRLHADQYRKGRRVPYIAHLLSVTALVLEAGELKRRRSRRCCMMR